MVVVVVVAIVVVVVVIVVVPSSLLGVDAVWVPLAHGERVGHVAS